MSKFKVLQDELERVTAEREEAQAAEAEFSENWMREQNARLKAEGALAAAVAESDRLRGALKALLDEFVVRGDNYLGASPSDVAMYRRMTGEALAGGAAAPPPETSSE